MLRHASRAYACRSCRTLAPMQFNRVWPSRYCPTCGGLVRRAPDIQQSWSLAVTELGGLAPVFALLVGAGIGQLLGGTTGLVVGLAAGIAALLAGLYAASIAEKGALRCECSLCHKQVFYRECTRKAAVHEG